ncbi:X8 domain-containing protein [Artemisia annua]|uniref:X8 domain-containing protein n=1 Tax=Artemisia annua TaxID=35608 RepID=A0A2U1PN16_ARTAN|nr:X8 domain-containing protein [Artemisia annua]
MPKHPCFFFFFLAVFLCTSALPSAPITNPVTAPAVNTAPGIVTVPGANPGGVSPVPPTTTTPVTNPVNPPAPVTNPVTTPSTNPGGQPTVNPVTTPTTNPGGQPTGNPVTTPSVGNAPTGRGQSWCIAKNGASQAALQSALDYACGIGGADCVTIQQGSSCYEPATLQNHASYAFNSYYQKNPVPTSCDFGGVATVTTTNPTPYNPTTVPAPATSSQGSTMPGIQSPTPGFSIGNNDPTGLGAFGASPPLMNSASASNNLQPFIELLMILPIILKQSNIAWRCLSRAQIVASASQRGAAASTQPHLSSRQ